MPAGIGDRELLAHAEELLGGASASGGGGRGGAGLLSLEKPRRELLKLLEAVCVGGDGGA